MAEDWKVRLLLKAEKPLRPGDVAKIFNCDLATVARWANKGKLESFRTGGGHRRFPVDSVRNLCVKLGLRYDERKDLIR